MPNLTNTELKSYALERKDIAEKATKGPWFHVGQPWSDGGVVNAGTEDPHKGIAVCDCQSYSEDQPQDQDGLEDADFIADSRTAVPTLADAVVRLCQENEKMRAMLERANASILDSIRYNSGVSGVTALESVSDDIASLLASLKP